MKNSENSIRTLSRLILTQVLEFDLNNLSLQNMVQNYCLMLFCSKTDLISNKDGDKKFEHVHNMLTSYYDKKLFASINKLR